MIVPGTSLATAYIPEDRRRALARGADLPHSDTGAVLFADISGFTPLTAALAQQLGSRRGAERLTRLLDQVYTELIAAVTRCDGSVIGFSGDAITCWFGAGGRASGGAQRAAMAASAMQVAMAGFADIPVSAGVRAALALKVAVAAGTVLRCVVGDPAHQRFDVIAGATVERVANLGELAARGEIIVDELCLAALPPGVVHGWRRGDDGTRGAVVVGLPLHMMADNVQETVANDPPDLPVAEGRTWLLPAVYARLEAEPDRFLAELRPAAALFVNFAGPDYDQDPAAAARLDAFVRWVQGMLAHYEGSLIQLTTGDKGSYLYAAFGAPLSHDDDLLRAVAAGLILVNPPAELAIRAPRAGIAHGLMRVGPYGSPSRRTYGVIGDATNLAARLMMRAAPGQVLLNASAAALANGHYRLDDLGLHSFKGKSEPQQVYAVAGRVTQPLDQVTSLHGAALVGRAREQALFAAEIARTLQGEGRLVRIEGEPGAGKSHLAAHVLRRAAAAGLRSVVAACQSTTTGFAYDALRQWLRGLLGFDDGPDFTDAAAQVGRVADALHQLNPQWLSRLPLLGDLLNLPIADNAMTAAFDARLRQEALTSLVVDVILEYARRSPLMLLVEDIHWMDEASQALLLALARVADGAPLLLVTVQRPPVRGQEGFLAALAGVANAVHVHLGEIDRAATAALVADRLGSPVDDLATDYIQLQAQGNPFFVEELVDNLRDGGWLLHGAGRWSLSAALFAELRAARCVEQRGDEWRLLDDASLSSLQLGAPASLQSLILARLDRLPERARLTLKVASVIGRVFEGNLLAAAHPTGLDATTLAAQLEMFQQREFARLDRGDRVPVYIFKHTITQEVVYGTLLEDQQQELHLAVAQALEAQGPAALERPLERLAYHYQQSDVGQPPVRAKALYYLEGAARRAQRDYANETALRYYRAALALDGRTAWLVEQARLLHILGERAEEAAVLDRLRALPDTPQVVLAFLRADFGEAISAYDDARAALQQVLTLAIDAGEVPYRVQALAQLGQLALRQGDLVQAQQWYGQALAMLDNSDLQTPAAGDVAFGLGVVARQQTDFAAAHAHFEQARRCYAAAGRRADEAKAYTALGTVAYFRKESATALELFRQALTIRRDIGDRQGEGSSLLNIAQALAGAGDYSQAQQLLHRALSIQQAIGNRWWENRVWNELGVLALLVGDWTTARANLEKALALSSAIGDESADLITRLNLALATRGEGRWSAAETQLRDCLAIAQRLEDGVLEANCWTELGLLSVEIGAWYDAEGCATTALAMYTASAMPQYAVTNRSTLALCNIQNGRLEAALAQVWVTERLLNENSGEGIDYPQRDCWVCAQVLRAAGQPAAAAEMIEMGLQIIQRRAERISDPAMRRQFLVAAPYNGLYSLDEDEIDRGFGG